MRRKKKHQAFKTTLHQHGRGGGEGGKPGSMEEGTGAPCSDDNHAYMNDGGALLGTGYA